MTLLANSKRLAAIEDHLDAIDSRLDRFKVVLERVDEKGDDRTLSINDLTKAVVQMKGTLEQILENHSDYANEVIRVHQENVALKSDIAGLKAMLTLTLAEAKQ